MKYKFKLVSRENQVFEFYIIAQTEEQAIIDAKKRIDQFDLVQYNYKIENFEMIQY